MSSTDGTAGLVSDAVASFGRGDLAAGGVTAQRLIDVDDHLLGHGILGDLAFLGEDLYESRRQYETVLRGFPDRSDPRSAARAATDEAA
jgi:hypothetical protein